MKSFVDGKETIYFSDSRRFGLYAVSYFVVFLCILLAFAAHACIYYSRLRLSYIDAIAPSEQWIASLINGAQIILFNYLFSAIAMKITEWENHRLERHFERALIGKC